MKEHLNGINRDRTDDGENLTDRVAASGFASDPMVCGMCGEKVTVEFLTCLEAGTPWKCPLCRSFIVGLESNFTPDLATKLPKLREVAAQYRRDRAHLLSEARKDARQWINWPAVTGEDIADRLEAALRCVAESNDVEHSEAYISEVVSEFEIAGIDVTAALESVNRVLCWFCRGRDRSLGTPCGSNNSGVN